MNFPNYALFELGFGYKYQYLLTALLYAIITKDIDYNNSEKFIEKTILRNNIHADPAKFIKQIKNIFPDINELIYNNNAIIMVEGEHGCFEDINLFTSNREKSIIRFIQVKGSMSKTHKSALDNSVIKTLFNTVRNKNIQLPFQLLILLNKNVSNHFFAKTIQDKVKIIVSVIKRFEFMEQFKKKNKSFYINFFSILEEYIDNSYHMHPNQNLHIQLFFRLKASKQYIKYNELIANNKLYKIVNSLKHILDNTQIIENLDYRLVYIFLKKHYGNDKLTKILWNIEMQSMNGESIGIQTVRNELKNINFKTDYVQKINFSNKNSSKNKFNIGKIL